jgi:hypothetical protein
MVETNFSVRFICDEDFIRELLLDKQVAAKVIMKLNSIHKDSKQYSMCHNIIPDECFKNAISDKQIRGPALLGAFHPISWPPFVLEERETESKIIKCAINLATKRPFRVAILTSKNKIKNYQENSHYKNTNISSAIKIFNSEEAIKIIDIVLGTSD